MDIVKKRIEDISKEDEFKIYELIQNNHGLVFHEVLYNKILSNTFNTKLFYFLAYDNDILIGACPYHSISKGLIKESYSGPTIFETPYGGWVYLNSYSIERLIAGLKLDWNESFDYWSNIQIVNDHYKSLRFNKRKTSIIDLKLQEEEIFNKIDSKRRNMIRKAYKSGITLKIMGIDGFSKYKQIMLETYQKANLIMKPDEYYLELFKFYEEKNQIKILFAEMEGALISGIILFGNQNIMHYWLGASKLNAGNKGHGEFLQWEAIKLTKSFGVKYYDMCVVEEKRLPHIAKFKLGISSNIVNYYQFNKRGIFYKVNNKVLRLLNNFSNDK